MARQRKKLKILPSKSTTTKNDTHYDNKDNLFADEHFGYYLMCTIPKSSVIKNPRRYIYYKFKKEYYDEKNKTCNLKYKTQPIHGRSCILDTRMKHKNLILEIISLIFKESKPVKLTESFLIAIGLIIDILESKNIILKNINDFKTEYQILIYEYMNKNLNYKNQDIRDVGRFFSELSFILENFEHIRPNRMGLNTKNNTLRELSSSIMYQLEYYSLNELNSIKDKVEQYWQFLKDMDQVLTLKNLLFTLFTWKELKLSSQRIYPNLLICKLFVDHGIDAKVILKSRPRKSDLIQIDRLKKLSENGINLLYDEKYAVIWTKELFPNYPRSMELNEKYNDVTKTLYARKSILTEFGISVEKVERYLYPTREAVYPLYLLLLIRTGLNNETLLDWRVEKINSEYKFKSDDLGIMTIVEGEKKRSNSSISCVLKNDSEEIKFINFYIKWCKDIYEYSKKNELFQYFDRLSIGTKIQIFNNRIIGYMRDSKNSFFKKYKIYNEKNEIINFIDHRLIRKSHNFQEYLRGKQEFERQLSKKHIDSKTTKNHYENNSTEWSEAKKHKIAKSQNLLVSIFRGDITRKENSLNKLLNGSIANCKNNKKPTFDHAPNLKENEYCLDWTKCLTSCEQACVIPKVHGPVIYAWIDFMEKQKEDFINEDHWYKEYGLDYDAAIDTVKYFTNDEKVFCKLEMNKHIEFVKLILKRTVKIGAIKSA